MPNIEMGIITLIITSIANVIISIKIFNKKRRHSFEQNKNRFILKKLENLEDSFSKLVMQLQHFNENNQKECELVEESMKKFDIDFQKAQYLITIGKLKKSISMFITSVGHDPSLNYDDDIKNIWNGIGSFIARNLNHDG